MNACKAAGANAVFCDVFLKGGDGGRELAEEVVKQCAKKSELCFAYDLNDSVEKKVSDVVRNVYGGDGAEFSDEALRKIKALKDNGITGLPVIIAKTQYSLSDDAKKLSRPTGFKIKVRDIIYKGGAGFIVAVAGDIMLMPGLSKTPSAEHIDIDENGNITGLS